MARRVCLSGDIIKNNNQLFISYKGTYIAYTKSCIQSQNKFQINKHNGHEKLLPKRLFTIEIQMLFYY